jgi:hypothetical protein
MAANIARSAIGADIRHVMKAALAILLALATAPLAASEDAKVYVGVVQDVGTTRLTLNLDQWRDVEIGFTCLPDACKSLQSIQSSDRIEAKFESRDGKTNTLVSVRRCTVPDAECDRAAGVQAREAVRERAQYDALVAQKKMAEGRLTELFQRNRQNLVDLPVCKPSRRLVHIDTPDLGSLPRSFPYPNGVKFVFEVGADGKVRNAAPESSEFAATPGMQGMYDALSAATFVSAKAACRQSMRMTFNLD